VTARTSPRGHRASPAAPPFRAAAARRSGWDWGDRGVGEWGRVGEGEVGFLKSSLRLRLAEEEGEGRKGDRRREMGQSGEQKELK
jgi:hypothetical protein